MASKPKKSTAELSALILTKSVNIPNATTSRELDLRAHCNAHLTSQIGRLLGQ
jgi:hypothetical protein